MFIEPTDGKHDPWGTGNFSRPILIERFLLADRTFPWALLRTVRYLTRETVESPFGVDY